jgi:hypothetical protein
MELGPVPGIRAVAFTSARPETRLPAAFVVDASSRSGEEAWTPSRQTSERGADDEDTDVIEDDSEERRWDRMQSRPYGRTIDLVA